MLSFATLAVQHIKRGEALSVQHLFVSDYVENRPGINDWSVDSVWSHSPYNTLLPRDAVTEPSPIPVLARLRDALGFSSSKSEVDGRLVEAQIRGVNAALVDILTACAPTLRTLYVDLITEPGFGGPTAPALLPVHTPLLTDLTLITTSPITLRTARAAPFANEPEDPCVPEKQSPLTSLRRVHILDDRRPWNMRTTRQTLDWLRPLAPNATSVRLSWCGLPIDMYHRFDPAPLPTGLERLEIHPLMGWLEFAGHHLYEHIFKQHVDGIRAPHNVHTGASLVFNGDWNANGEVYTRPRLAAAQWLHRVAEDGGAWVSHSDTIPLYRMPS
jgi:hypothetical protein